MFITQKTWCSSPHVSMGRTGRSTRMHAVIKTTQNMTSEYYRVVLYSCFMGLFFVGDAQYQYLLDVLFHFHFLLLGRVFSSCPNVLSVWWFYITLNRLSQHSHPSIIHSYPTLINDKVGVECQCFDRTSFLDWTCDFFFLLWLCVPWVNTVHTHQKSD